jgi:hypothetical protein
LPPPGGRTTLVIEHNGGAGKLMREWPNRFTRL